MKKIIIMGALILVCLGGYALAGSTATQVQLGYLTTSGCSGGQSYCWLPWSVSVPLPASSN